MSTPQEVLQHYITMLMERAGLKIDSDNYAEIADIIDDTIAEARQPIADIERRLVALESSAEVKRLKHSVEQLRAALVQAQTRAQDAQGDWVAVDASQAPFWALPLKEIAADIGEALAYESS